MTAVRRGIVVRGPSDEKKCGAVHAPRRARDAAGGTIGVLVNGEAVWIVGWPRIKTGRDGRGRSKGATLLESSQSSPLCPLCAVSPSYSLYLSRSSRA